MAILWICCHCGNVTRLKDHNDGLQGRCWTCGRYSIMQGPHVGDDQADGDVAHTVAAESRVDGGDDDKQAQFAPRDLEQEAT